MTLKKQLKRHLGKKATRRIYAAMPWVGGALALAAGTVLQRRGVRGALDDVRDIPDSISGRSKGAPSYAGDRDDELVGSH